MWKWTQGAISAVAGTAEPEYGAGAVHPVSGGVQELTNDDLKWINPNQANVETQTWYITCDDGHVGFVQIVHSYIPPVPTAMQFSCRLWHPTDKSHHTWVSVNLEEFEFSNENTDIKATKTNVKLVGDSKYTFDSVVSNSAIVDLTFVRTTPGCKIGNGKTTFGTDPKQPWGSVSHRFWPSATVDGSILVNGTMVEIKGKAMFVMALQGMRPNHIASQWNFANYQGSRASAVMVEFTTPPSYASTKVGVGAIVLDGKLIMANANPTVEHLATDVDPETLWPAPTKLKVDWSGTGENGQAVRVSCEVELKTRIERIDVMAEIPAFIKSVASGISGTNPFIYQYANPAKLDIQIDDDTIQDDGLLLSEATFIS